MSSIIDDVLDKNEEDLDISGEMVEDGSTVNQQIKVSKSSSEIDMMEKIAENQQSLEDIKFLSSSVVTDQLKVFVISQARNELKRVVKLTKYLDKLEKSYMDAVDDAISNGEISLKEYSEVIGLITSLLTRSSSLLSNVLKDDSLTAILNTTVYSGITTTQTTSVVANLNDPHSREKVRTVISKILANTQHYVEDTDYSVIEESDLNE